MTPPAGAPDYFALFQSMFSPGAQAPAANPLALLDPKELERKIGEMETVLAWLRATAGVMEATIGAMKAQQAMLASLSATPEAAASPPADFMNPAMWAFGMMQPGAASTPEPKSPGRKPRKPPKR